MEPQLEYASSQFELLSNTQLRTGYFESIRQEFMRSAGLPLGYGDLTEQPDPVTIMVRDETSKLTPDNEQARGYLANQFVELLNGQVRKHSVRELREVGVLIEAERMGLTWVLTASVRY